MSFALTWMAPALDEAGVKWAEDAGWRERGRAEMGNVAGVLIHHTAGPRDGNMPSLRTLREGRSDLPGPLCNLGLGRDGTFYLIAAGRANHAGAGRWPGIADNDGNSRFIGIECENTGTTADLPWPDAQMKALTHGVAALLRRAGRGADACIGHREYAPVRKIDPLIDMGALRAAIAAILDGTTPPLVLIPHIDPRGRPTLRRPTSGAPLIGPDVNDLRQALGLGAGGAFDAATEAAVRQFQRARGLVDDGIVGPKTWGALLP